MMVIDASALVAIMQKEPEKELFLSKILQAERAVAGIVNIMEASMVLHARRGDPGLLDLDKFMLEMHIEPWVVSADQLMLARQAFIKYGKGRHSAGLNLGDCFAYGLSKSLDAALLYKGNDFNKTDIIAA